MLKNKIFASFMVILAVFSAGCGEEEKKSSSVQTLILGTSADNKPFEFFMTSGGGQEIVGYDIDVAVALGKALGVQVQAKDMDFNGLIPALQSGRIDLAMSAITPTPEREQNVSFSDPYFVSPIGVISRADLTIRQGKDLEGLKVGAQLGTVFETLVQSLIKSGLNIQLVSLNRLGELVQEVLAGRLDCVIIDSIPAKAYIKGQPSLTYGMLQEHEIRYAIAFPKGSPWVQKVNEALKELEKKGELAKISKKWFSNE